MCERKIVMFHFYECLRFIKMNILSKTCRDDYNITMSVVIIDGFVKIEFLLRSLINPPAPFVGQVSFPFYQDFSKNLFCIDLSSNYLLSLLLPKNILKNRLKS